MKEITSVSNPQVKAWKKLATKKGRQQSQTYLLDGWHLVKEALNSGKLIQKILVTPSFKHLADLEILPEIQYFSSRSPNNSAKLNHHKVSLLK